MKGVSEVIAIILILMITISLAGLAYMFMSTTMSDVTSSAGSTVDTTTSSMSTSFVIESISHGKVYVRNTGQDALTGFSVYVSDQAVNASVPASIASGAVGTINVTSIIFEGDTVKVTSGNGVSVSKTAPSEWYGSVGYWKLDESTGTVAYDSSAYGNTGTLMNGPTWTSGRFGNGLQFDGTNDYVNPGNSVSFNIINALTISVWVNSQNTQTCTGGTYILRIEKGNPTVSGGSYGLWWHSCNVLYFYVREPDDSGYVTQDVHPSIGRNDWHHIAATFDGSTQTESVYVDGVLQASSNVGISSIYPSLTTNFVFGYGSTGYFFNGTIDEVAIWNRALTSQEILKIYNKAIY